MANAFWFRDPLDTRPTSLLECDVSGADGWKKRMEYWDRIDEESARIWEYIIADDSEDEEEEEQSMSSDDEISSQGDEEYSGLDLDGILQVATERGDAETVMQALENGANVNCSEYPVPDQDRPIECTPLETACSEGYDPIVRILLDAGADARWKDSHGSSAILAACRNGHLSTVQLLINHDSGLLELGDIDGDTPLIFAIRQQNSDMVRFLLDSGADAHHADQCGETALMHACKERDFEIVRLLLAAGADVDARDDYKETALHCAARNDWNSHGIMLELILRHNANMLVVDEQGLTPFDLVYDSERSGAFINRLLKIYGKKLTQDHGRLALHELLKVSEYSFAGDLLFHPPLNPLRINLPLGQLELEHWRTLLRRLDTELIHNRDATGKLPIHIACQTGAPFDVLAMLLELDPATLHMADHAGSLPVHLLCGSGGAAEYSSVRYLVEQVGGFGTLAARNHQGALPLHVLCAGSSTNPSLPRTVQYMIQSFPGSVAMRTNAGEYPFLLAAANDWSSASLSVVYELVRANPGLVV